MCFSGTMGTTQVRKKTNKLENKPPASPIYTKLSPTVTLAH